MRVFGRVLVLGLVVSAWIPEVTSAAPIVLEGSGSALSGSACDVGTMTLSDNCSLFEFDPSSALSLTGEFQSASDAVLFSFTFLQDSSLSVTTSSFAASNFDPTLGLFYGDGSIVQLTNSDGTLSEARFFDIDLDGGNWDDQISAVPLVAGSYFLALIADPNQYRSSLMQGFECDAPELGCSFNDLGSAFALTVSATPLGSEPVPEPGTLTLMAGGAIAGLIHHRRSRKRNRAEPVSR